MPATASPVFGKRQIRTSPNVSGGRAVVPPSSPPRTDLPAGHAAFFAAVRAELHESVDERLLIVPRSSRAALLSGLVIGCTLAGFDVTGRDGASRLALVAHTFGVSLDPAYLLPGLILLGLVGGARASALTVTAVHGALAQARHTSHAAYGAAGATAALCFAAALSALFGHSPAHGWFIEAASGAGAGFFYRVFAGARPA